ncbi:MAG: pre-peptidase C-terminal domain-containing protein [Deltaproteobacteria bacterium]|nr:pre-peptidase C-terminal domain-containing protein [Deltaproteobacteria bacterium]
MSFVRLFACLSVLALVCGGCGGDPKQGDDDVVDVFQCSDGEDNDADGKVDFPEDPGCTAGTDDSEDTPTAPQCSDGRDNDMDGATDYPMDPGCISPNQDDEMDDCPSGPNCPQCGNGIDDDMNGSTDFPDDAMGCSSASDPEELVNDPVACGAGLLIKNLPTDGTDTGTLAATSTSMVSSTCGGGSGALAIAYAINVPRPSIIVASTDNPGTTADTVIDIRSADCDATAAAVACNDNIDVDNDNSKVTASVPAGRYYIIIQGYDAAVIGDYDLTVDVFAGEGSACALPADCGPGLVCRVPAGQTAMVCAKPVCNDGLDDDADLKIDYPADPGCASPTDDSELDDCPSGPNCPACSNGQDDDADTFTDYPLDTGCSSASGASEACDGEVDPILAITTGTTTGTTIGAANNHAPACGSSTNTGADILFTLDLPAVTSLTLDTDTSDADTVLSLLTSTCAEPSLDCDDDGGDSSGASLIEVGPLAAGTYIVAVDAYNDVAGNNGAFALHVSGVLPAGASCEPAASLGGALVCPVTHPCGGAAGAKTCQPPACSNSIDDDGDLLIDFPNEPGCTGPLDSDETDTCPAGVCPMCSNGIDDDGDGAMDYPNDSGCASAAGSSEFVCGETDPVVAITMPTTSGTLVGASNDHQYTTCGSSTNVSVERSYTLTVPALTSLTVDTNGMSTDVVLELLPATCVGPLDCDDESGDPGGAALVQAGPLAAGTYVVVVNAYSASTTLGAYELHVSGILPTGASCEPAATLGGAFTCSAAAPCSGVAGSRTCQGNQCNDGIDNNGDGATDYPNDSGCVDPFGATEATTVTVCSNTLDDDGDTRTDYALDNSCWSAAGNNEAFCNVETDRVSQIVAPVTTGTTTALHNDHPPTTCQSTSTANDMTFALVLPVPVTTLTIDTNGSSFDTVMSWRDSTCTMIECDDDDGTSVQSQIVRTAVAPGTYAIVVDGYESDAGTFSVQVRGTVAAGTACTSNLFVSGVLACATGSCTGGVCP